MTQEKKAEETAMASMAKIRKALESIDLEEMGMEYAYIGIRVQEEAYGAKVGEAVDHCSKVWIDGDETDEELDGVCAMNASQLGCVGCEYFGNVVLVLGADRVDYGEDAGEIIMQDATILAVIEL